MIELTRFNGERFVLNANLIEMVESTPDTVIRLLNGKKVIVRETVEEVVQRALEYARRVHHIAVPHPEEEAASPAREDAVGADSGAGASQ
jgi:flagellar protein FlbD